MCLSLEQIILNKRLFARFPLWLDQVSNYWLTSTWSKYYSRARYLAQSIHKHIVRRSTCMSELYKGSFQGGYVCGRVGPSLCVVQKASTDSLLRDTTNLLTRENARKTSSRKARNVNTKLIGGGWLSQDRMYTFRRCKRLQEHERNEIACVPHPRFAWDVTLYYVFAVPDLLYMARDGGCAKCAMHGGCLVLNGSNSISKVEKS